MKNLSIFATAVLALGVASGASASTTYGLLTTSQTATSTANNGTTASFADGLLTATQVNTSISYALATGSSSTSFMDTFNFSLGTNEKLAFSVSGNTASSTSYAYNTAKTYVKITTTKYNIGDLLAVVKNSGGTVVNSFGDSSNLSLNSLTELQSLVAGNYSVTISGKTTGTITSGYYGVVAGVISPTLLTGSHTTTTAAGGQYAFSINAVPVPVPEPESLALILSGLTLVGFVARRRKVQN